MTKLPRWMTDFKEWIPKAYDASIEWFDEFPTRNDVCLFILAFSTFLFWSWAFCGNIYLGKLLAGNRSQVYSTVTGAAVSMLGFALTAKTVAMTAITNAKLKNLDAETTDSLWYTFTKALASLGLCAIVAFAGLIFDRDDIEAPRSTAYCFLFDAMIAFSILSVVNIVRSVRLLSLIAKVLSRSDSK